MSTNRRQFLQTAAAIGSASLFSSAAPLLAGESANDRPLIGCIGTGSMGKGDARDLNNYGDIVAVCDVDAGHLEEARLDEKIGKGKADAYGDYRRVLERDDIDVVSVVTPDHWHVKIAIEALQAGKHVFCQKPLTLTLEENQLIRKRVKRYRTRCFLVGTQQRSSRNCSASGQHGTQGAAGRYQEDHCGHQRQPDRRTVPDRITATGTRLGHVAGPGAAGRLPQKRCHYEFRWWYEYSGGKFTDWGAHHVDIATLGIWAKTGQGRGPLKIDGTDAQHPVPFKDGYPTVDDSYNTSHDFAVECNFD